jgi:signal transduction histidine kinase/ligand-binding sensor domain-containing protein
MFESPSTAYVYTICEGADKTVWIGTQTGLRAYRNGALQPMIADPLLNGKSIVGLFFDSQQRLWVGIMNYHGIVCYEHGDFRALQHALLSGHTSTIQESPRGVLWFGTNGAGLVRYDSTKEAWTGYGAAEDLDGKNVTELFSDPSGDIWIGALGLHRLDHVTGKIERVMPMSVPSIRRIARDREGSIWVATYGDGLMRVRPARYKILNSDGGLPSDFVRTVMQDTSGTMWLAQSGRGAVKIAPDGTITRVLPNGAETQGEDALAIFTTRAGETFLGTSRALYVWRDGNLQRYPDLRGTRALFEDSHGTLWIGALELGVTCWKDGVFTRIPFPESTAHCTVCAFAEDTDGTVFAATTSQGLIQVRGTQVTVLDSRSVLPSDEVRAMYLDVDGNLWVGTKRGLAIRMGGRWYAHSWMREAIDEHVNGIFEIPGDYVLLSTTRGVVRFNRRELLDAVRRDAKPKYLSQVIIAESARTGSIGATCSPMAWRTKSGEIWIAARKGAVVIDPNKIRIDTTIPPVRVERLTADRASYDNTGTIELPAGARQLTFEYTALTFVQPNRVFFRYQLEGYEDSPVEAGTRRLAFYNNLPPGKYVFRVTACNSDGVWNDEGAALAFTVLPFFYQTWWFRVGAVLASAGVIAGLFSWRVRRIHREAQALQAQNVELERRIAERTAELAKSLEELQAAQRDLLDSSRLAGMAEVATGVLHNIGNALNSVNVSADVARTRIRNMKAPSLERVARLLEEQREHIAEFIANDQRGRKLPEFLLQLSEHFATECAATLKELESLAAGIEHIKTVVAAQQEYARGGEVCEMAAPAELIDYALRITAASITRHAIQVNRNFEPVPAVNIQRQKALQVLVNLINNAKDAIEEAQSAQRQMTISLRQTKAGEVEIEVTDDGVGIAPENLTRIFNFGFTTKRKGHGFGLHSSALVAKELGGQLEVRSEGVGRGASFVFRLPPTKSEAAGVAA